MEALSFRSIAKQGKPLDFAITLQRLHICAAAWDTPAFDTLDPEDREDFVALVRDRRLTIFARGCAQALLASGVAVSDLILSAMSFEFPAIDMGKHLLEAERLRLCRVCGEMLSPLIDRLEVTEESPELAEKPTVKRKKGDGIARALTILMKHPEWDNVTIAGKAVIDPSVLSKSKQFKKARNASKGVGMEAFSDD